jgi:hypothetical protein
LYALLFFGVNNFSSEAIPYLEWLNLFINFIPNGWVLLKTKKFLLSGETKIVKFGGVANSKKIISLKIVAVKFGPKNCSTIQPF